MRVALSTSRTTHEILIFGILAYVRGLATIGGRGGGGAEGAVAPPLPGKGERYQMLPPISQI